MGCAHSSIKSEDEYALGFSLHHRYFFFSLCLVVTASTVEGDKFEKSAQTVDGRFLRRRRLLDSISVLVAMSMILDALYLGSEMGFFFAKF